MAYTGLEPRKVDSEQWSMPSNPLPADTPIPVSHALEFLADAYLEQGQGDDAADIFAELGQIHDRMRAAYWKYRQSSCTRNQ